MGTVGTISITERRMMVNISKGEIEEEEKDS